MPESPKVLGANEILYPQNASSSSPSSSLPSVSNVTGSLGDVLGFGNGSNYTDPCEEIRQSQAGDAILINQRFPFVVVAGCTVCLAGIASTLFLLFIFSRKSMRSHNIVYLAVLALFDISIMTNYILLIAVGIMKDYFRLLFLHRLYHWYMSFLFTLGRITQTSQTYLIVAATVERYMIVTRNSPFSLRRKTGVAVGCVTSSRYMAIISVILLAIALRWSAYLEVTVKYSNCTGFQGIYFSHGDILTNEVYVQYNLYGSQVINVYVPFLLLLILNLLIFRKMRSTSCRNTDFKNQVTSMPNQLGQSRAILIRQTLDKRVLRDATNTMAAIVSGYLISNSLNVIITITEQLNMNWLYDHIELYTIAADISSFCVISTSASRLPIYYWCNAKIRELIDQTCSHGCACGVVDPKGSHYKSVVLSTRNGSLLTQRLTEATASNQPTGVIQSNCFSDLQQCSTPPPEMQPSHSDTFHKVIAQTTQASIPSYESLGGANVAGVRPPSAAADCRYGVTTYTDKAVTQYGMHGDRNFNVWNGDMYHEMSVTASEPTQVVTEQEIKEWISEVFL